MASPPAVPALEAAVIEANAVALGVALDALMEAAGQAVAEEALRHLPTPPARVAVLLGPGNNGGDGAVAAHFLRQRGVEVGVWEVAAGTHRSRPAQRALERTAREGPVRSGAPTGEELRAFPLVIDALLGVGHTAPLRGTLRSAVDAIRESNVPVLAVDVPTGLGDPDGVHARWTIALTHPKAEVPADRAGGVVVREIGIPSAAWAETGPGDFLRYDGGPRSGPGARGGRVVVIGGGPYAGAPALAGLAALRAGAERATLIVPEAAARSAQGFAPDLVVRIAGGSRLAPEFLAEVQAELRSGSVGAVVLGPGAGAAPETVEFFRALLRAPELSVPAVIDADALSALERNEDRASTWIATPNRGEFRRLAARWAPGHDALAPEAIRAVAAALGCTVVSKGALDVIDDGRQAATNRHHPPEQAVAGAGDVLSGVLGALLARGLPAMGAARLGTYWAGEAGHRVVAEQGPGLVASDLVAALGPAAREALGRLRGPGDARP